MSETAISASPEEPKKGKHFCDKHNHPQKYSRKHKLWYCTDCLYAAYLSNQAQQEAVKRYRNTDKGKDAQRRYEQSEGGQTARQRYLKSDKYKQRRKEYNQRLKESLQLARAARITGALPSKGKKVLPPNTSPLLADILEFMELANDSPIPTEVQEWSVTLYKKPISVAEAAKLIKQAKDLPNA
jgi:hypothetical protein